MSNLISASNICSSVVGKTRQTFKHDSLYLGPAGDVEFKDDEELSAEDEPEDVTTVHHGKVLVCLLS